MVLVFLNHFDVLMSKIIFKKSKNIIDIYFNTKNYLKSNRNHNTYHIWSGHYLLLALLRSLLLRLRYLSILDSMLVLFCRPCGKSTCGVVWCGESVWFKIVGKLRCISFIKDTRGLIMAKKDINLLNMFYLK